MTSDDLHDRLDQELEEQPWHLDGPHGTTEKSYECAWLDYAVANERANKAYRSKMERLHRAYTVQVAREVHSVCMAVSR